MERHIFEKLQDWKIKPDRKPLILMGARQVGKTYILKKFAESHYENCIYLNFEDQASLKTLFTSDLQPAKILTAITLETQQKIIPGKTLIFFDEVQECPNALISLKYFQEKANEYHVCAAGSLLGVKLANTQGFPVGKVDFLTLYPMNFFEFLEAIHETELKNYLLRLNTIEPLAEIIHEKLINYLKYYLYIGGMPESVQQWCKTQDFLKVREVQQAILKAYTLDFSKHAPPEIIMKIHQVWQIIPSQLAKENKKFIYSVIRKNARAKEFETAIQWLIEAGLIHKVTQISTPSMPLSAYAYFDFFKTYLLDVGLLGAMAQLSSKILIEGNQYFTEFKGSYIENFVAQELVKTNELYYWASEGQAEIDFVIAFENHAYPLEIKSGLSNKKKSLLVYDAKYKPSLLIRSSAMNLKKDGKVLNCPLYLIEQLATLILISPK